MSAALEIAAVGLEAQQKALDVLANNITNLNTTGFKRSDVRFSEIMTAHTDPAVPSAAPQTQPDLAGVSARAVLALSEQGELEATGRALDLAIEGAGFLELMGPEGKSYLWRGGSLDVTPDGFLSGSSGLQLRSMISIPVDATAIEIGADGEVRARVAGDAEPVSLGALKLVLLDNPDSVKREDGGLYVLSDASVVRAAQPGEEGAGRFVQGSIERSNVDLNQEMVRLMIVQRAYAASAQVVQAADQMLGIANTLRRS
jgi:flagellar basal-body rod protein FlgG